MRKLLSTITLAGALLAAGSYQIIKKFPLPGEGGWDYLTYDSESKRLFVSHATQTHVVDAETGKELGSIAGKGVHGTALVHKQGKGFITNGASNSVTVFDLKTLSVTAELPTGKKPDGIMFDAASGLVIVNNNGGGSSTLIDPATAKAVGTVELGGAPESSASGDGFIFTNLEDTSEMVKIDVKAAKVVERWKLAPCETPTALVFDPASHLLLAGCRNKLMVVVDSRTGKVAQSEPIGDKVDAAGFDAATRTAYFSNGDGTVNMFRVETSGRVTPDGHITTQFGAKTMALDAKAHKLFLSAADYQQAEGSGKRMVKPGSFAVLVVGQ